VIQGRASRPAPLIFGEVSELIIGEKMSEWVVLDDLVWAANGDIYEDEEHERISEPLDLGRLIYVKLRTGLDKDLYVEVYWNHITDIITVEIVKAAGRQFVAVFAPVQWARTDLLQRVDQFIDAVKDRVK
jgi:hypothetical protein